MSQLERLIKQSGSEKHLFDEWVANKPCTFHRQDNFMVCVIHIGDGREVVGVAKRRVGKNGHGDEFTGAGETISYGRAKLRLARWLILGDSKMINCFAVDHKEPGFVKGGRDFGIRG